MSEIIINPYNETYVRIECDPSIAMDLHDYFTITIPNPQFMRKKWNGKLRLLDKRRMQIYKGLIPYIEDWAKDHDCFVTFSDPSLNHQNEISLFETEQFAKSLNIYNNGKSINPYDHQIAAVTHALRKKRITLVSPTASGKSLVIYMLIRSLASKKILIIVPTTNLVEQLYSDFEDYSTENKWKVYQHVHRIYAGHEKYTNLRVIISTWQSLQTLPKEYFESFDVVIGDEAHGSSASSLKEIIGSCINAKYKIGLTGTIQNTKCHFLVIEGLFGTIYKPTTTAKLIKERKLAQFQIKCIVLKHKQPVRFDYQEELAYLISNQKRNNFIRNLAMSLENNTLILYQFVTKHGEILRDMLLEVCGKKKNIYFISGKIEAEVREEIRKITEKENNAIIVASFRTFSMGANMKNLHNIIFASPSKARITIMQSIGRELRLHSSKECAYLFDVSDDLSYTVKDNYTFNHFLERLKLYHEEKFPFKIYNVELNDE